MVFFSFRAKKILFFIYIFFEFLGAQNPGQSCQNRRQSQREGSDPFQARGISFLASPSLLDCMETCCRDPGKKLFSFGDSVVGTLVKIFLVLETCCRDPGKIV